MESALLSALPAFRPGAESPVHSLVHRPMQLAPLRFIVVYANLDEERAPPGAGQYPTFSRMIRFLGENLAEQAGFRRIGATSVPFCMVTAPMPPRVPARSAKAALRKPDWGSRDVASLVQAENCPKSPREWAIFTQVPTLLKIFKFFPDFGVTTQVIFLYGGHNWGFPGIEGESDAIINQN